MKLLLLDLRQRRLEAGAVRGRGRIPARRPRGGRRRAHRRLSAEKTDVDVREGVRVPSDRHTREVSICAAGRARSLAPVASSFRMAGLEDAAEDLLERLGDIG